MFDSTRRVPQRPDALPFCIRVIRAIRGEFYFGDDSRLLFLAEFLKTRIISERIEHWIEPEQRRSERRAHTHCATVRDGVALSGDGAVGFSRAPRHPREDLDRTWT